MGWLNFLSRKSPVNNQDDGLKAQAYDETVAANPPIRGTYPVAGNGPNILESFQKAHPHLKDTNSNASPAPHLAIPPFLERPNTAPAHRSSEGSARPKSQSASSVNPLPPPKKRHGPYKLPSKLPDERGDEIANKSLYSVPSPTFVRNRNSSIFSADSTSTRKFVDLLEAQSFIKPSDFYGRVKATGAKDYGEDVADRNIGGQSSSVNPTQTEEIFKKNFSFGVDSDSKDVNRPPSSRKRHSVGSGLRTKSISSNFHSTLPVIVSTELPQENEDKNTTSPVRKAPRRKSLHSYVPPSSAELCTDRPSSSSRAKHVEGTGLPSFPSSLQEKARAVAREGFEHDLSVDLSQVIKPIRPSRDAREIPAHGQDSDDDIYYECNDSRQDPLARVDQYRSTKGSSRRGSTPNVSSLTAFKQASKSGNLQTPQSPYWRRSTIQNSLPGVEEHMKNRDSPRCGYEAGFDIHDSFREFSSSHIVEPSESRLAHSRPNSRDERNYRNRNRSAVSVSAKSLKHTGMGDVVPERGSSIRRWSLTSETGGSTQSSNPFRPQSGHTTNTSVDLTPRAPLPKTIESHPMFLSESNRASPENRSEIDTHESLYHEVDPELLPGSNRRRPSIDFVIDEDASSVDSFDNPQHSAGEFEKDLLFQGYGFEGSQLPGLPGLFDAGPSKPRKALSQRTHSFSAYRDQYHLNALNSHLDVLPLGSRYSARSLQHTSRPTSSRLRMPDFSDSDSESGGDSELKYNSEEELNFDIPLTRSIGSRRQSYSSRRRFETNTESLRESDTVFPDMSRVAHLRRETKTKQRTSTGSLRKAKGKGKAADIGIPRIGLDDPSNYADIES